MALLDDFETWRAELWGTPGQKLVEEEDEVCCPLPLMLQDLCLLVIINEVHSYPVELLSSLPRWLRSRLVTTLPALQLFCLKSSPVAEGVDVDELWKTRMNHGGFNHLSLYDSGHPLKPRPESFQLEIGNVAYIPGISYSHFFYSSPTASNLDIEMRSTLKAVTETKHDGGMKAYLLQVASEILSVSSRYNFNQKALYHKLVSIRGDVLLSNLHTGSIHQPCSNEMCSHSVWKKQATALTTSQSRTPTTSYRPEGCAHYRYRSSSWWSGRQNIYLTPSSLAHLCDNTDPIELLTILMKQDNLQPSSVSIHVEEISRTVLNGLRAEQLSHDCGGHLTYDNAKYTSLMSHFLGEVVILRLKCDKYENVGVLLNMVNAAGHQNKLKHLLCSLPDMYMDIVQPFSKFFTLQNFYQLTLEVDSVYPLVLVKLLLGFLMAPCTQIQKFVIFFKHELQFPTPLKESQLASLTMTSNTPPPCGVQHKILEFSSQREFTNVLYLVLQFPVIRLKELTLVHLDKFHQYLHFCAIHPDLQTSKLVINFRRALENADFLATVETDLISLIKMPCLEEFSINGVWGKFPEVKCAITSGLQARSKGTLIPPLRKLALELGSAKFYEKHDIQILCDSLFSLPELEKLTVVFGNGFVELFKQPDYEETFYKSWLRNAQSVQLKSIFIQAPLTVFKKIKLTVSNLSFTQKSLDRWPPSSKQRYLHYYHDLESSSVYVGDNSFYPADDCFYDSDVELDLI